MKVQNHFAMLVEALNLTDLEEIEKAIAILREARKNGAHVWLVGNGGSAATCAHFANDLLKMGHIRAIDVAGMTPVTLAYGNDYGWERMFANILTELVEPLDVVVAISCSGTSPNVVAAVRNVAWKVKVIALTGPSGGAFSHLPLVEGELGLQSLIRVMSNEIRVMEDVHMAICHAIAGALNDKAR